MLQEPDVLIWSSIQDATRIRKLPFEIISGVWLNIVSSFSHSKAHIAKNSLSTVGSRNNLVECITFRIVRQKLPLLHALYTERLWNYRCCLLNCYLGEWENSTFSCSVTSGNFWGCILGRLSLHHITEIWALARFTTEAKIRKKAFSYFHIRGYKEFSD